MLYKNKKITFNRIKNKLISIFFDEQWSILVCDKNKNILKHIVPPKDRIWADPFPVEYNEKLFIFVEQQIRHENGTLGFIELFDDYSYSDFIPILQRPYHLSFPNIFNVFVNEKLQWYMIPETNENKNIELYRSIDFPYKWKFEMELLSNITAVDSTLFYHANKWWLFTSTVTSALSVNENLHIFYSDTFPSGHWLPHPMNPVVVSPTNSRMAGKIFYDDGSYYRPAQNCFRNYGSEININRIHILNENFYKEEIFSKIVPDKEYRAVCTHTINFTENYILRDIKTRKIK